MTSTQARDYFLLLQDKYGSPNVIPGNVYDFLNHGVNEYINRLFPSNQGGVVNFEEDKNVTANIQPLIYAVSVATTNGSGVVTTAVLNTALTTAVGSSAEYFRIESIGETVSGVTYPVKYVRQNNIWSFTRNYFKKPASTKAKFTLIANGLQFYPTTTLTGLTVAVIKKPNILSDSVNPELGDMEMYVVIAIALQLAGVATRDEEIIQDLRNITLQGK